MHKRMVSCYFQRDYLAAEAMACRAIREYPGNPRPYLTLAASLGQLGRTDEANTALDAAIVVSPSIFKFLTDCRPSYYRPVDHEHLIDGVRKAGWTRHEYPGQLSVPEVRHRISRLQNERPLKKPSQIGEMGDLRCEPVRMRKCGTK